MTQEDHTKIQRAVMLLEPMGFRLLATRERPGGEIVVTLAFTSSAAPAGAAAAAGAAGATE